MPASRNYSSTAGLMHLVGGITGAAASLIVDTVTGLPTVPFTLLLDPGLGMEEIVEVTAAGGTTLTVTRGVDGTSAQAHTNGAEVRHAYSARDFQDSRNHEANTTTAHGVTGAVVGTTNVQALTNKTLDGSLNTFTAIPKTALPADVLYGVDTAWIAPPLTNSWANVGGIWQTATYRKLANGDVELRGLVNLGNTSPVFNLPAGYRPLAGNIVGIAAAAGSAQLVISTNGDVTVTNYSGGGTNVNVCLTGVNFSTLA